MKKFIIFLYSIFLISLSIFSYSFVDPSLSYLSLVYSGFAFSQRTLAAMSYAFFVAVFFLFYLIFLSFGIKKKLSIKETILIVGITVVVLFFSYPAMLSYDIFNYIATSKVLFFYHENPYIIMPIEFLNDPLLSFMHAANKVALYGPAWILLTGIPHFAGLNNFILTLLSFKLFIVLFYLALTFLIYKITKNIFSVLLFALNPLVAIETIVSGHNDAAMIFLALLSFYLLRNKKIILSLCLFFSSVFIKYSTLLLLPIFIYMFFLLFKNKPIKLERIFYWSAISMFFAFLMSPIREEIYPWYAIWFFIFACLVPNRKFILYASFAFSFGLLLRYIPFMYSGTHADKTPFIKNIVTFAPPFVVISYFAIKKKVWLKIFSH